MIPYLTLLVLNADVSKPVCGNGVMDGVVLREDGTSIELAIYTENDGNTDACYNMLTTDLRCGRIVVG